MIATAVQSNLVCLTQPVPSERAGFGGASDRRFSLSLIDTMANLALPRKAPNIGECIYCGSTKNNLSKEHAIPYGLNGPWTLLRASCSRCADITHRFERDTLRSLLWPVRTVLALQTRRPTLRPKSLPLELESGGVYRTIHLPLNEYPLYLPTPLFAQPGYLAGDSMSPQVTPELRFLHLAGPSLADVVQRHTADFAGARLNFSPQDFARTLAKIAFTAAVYVLGLAPFTTTPIRRIILGQDKSVSHWVGSWIGETVNEPKGLNAMKIRASGTDIHVVLRLFAQFGAPEYHVVLGTAAPEYSNSAAWPWK